MGRQLRIVIPGPVVLNKIKCILTARHVCFPYASYAFFLLAVWNLLGGR